MLSYVFDQEHYVKSSPKRDNFGKSSPLNSDQKRSLRYVVYSFEEFILSQKKTQKILTMIRNIMLFSLFCISCLFLSVTITKSIYLSQITPTKNGIKTLKIRTLQSDDLSSQRIGRDMEYVPDFELRNRLKKSYTSNALKHFQKKRHNRRFFNNTPGVHVKFRKQHTKKKKTKSRNTTLAKKVLKKDVEKMESIPSNSADKSTSNISKIPAIKEAQNDQIFIVKLARIICFVWILSFFLTWTFFVLHYILNSQIEENLNKGMNNLCNIETVKSPIFRFFICPNYEFLYIEVGAPKGVESLLSTQDQSVVDSTTSLIKSTRYINPKLIIKQRIRKKKNKICKTRRQSHSYIGEMSVAMLPLYEAKKINFNTKSILFNDLEKIKKRSVSTCYRFEEKEKYTLLKDIASEKNAYNLSLSKRTETSGILDEESQKNSSLKSIRNYTELYINPENSDVTYTSKDISFNKNTGQKNDKKVDSIKVYKRVLSDLDQIEKKDVSNSKIGAKNNEKNGIGYSGQYQLNSSSSILRNKNYKKLDVKNHLKLINKENVSPNEEKKSFDKKSNNNMFTI